MLEKLIKNNYHPDAPARVGHGHQQAEQQMGRRVAVTDPEPAGTSELVWPTRQVVSAGLVLRRTMILLPLLGQTFPLALF